MLDLNDFKSINDTMGHAAGGPILTEMGRVLKGTCRENDIVARIGGDEFVMFLPGAFDWQTGKRKIGEIQESLRTVMISAWGIRESGPASEPPCARRTGWITRPCLRLRTRPCIWTRSSPKTGMKAGRQERKKQDRTIS